MAALVVGSFTHLQHVPLTLRDPVAPKTERGSGDSGEFGKDGVLLHILGNLLDRKPWEHRVGAEEAQEHRVGDLRRATTGSVVACQGEFAFFVAAYPVTKRLGRREFAPR